MTAWWRRSGEKRERERRKREGVAGRTARAPRPTLPPPSLHNAPSQPQLVYAPLSSGAADAAASLVSPSAAMTGAPQITTGALPFPAVATLSGASGELRNTSLESVTSAFDFRASLAAAGGGSGARAPRARAPSPPARATPPQPAPAAADSAALASHLMELEAWIASVEAAELADAARGPAYDAALAAAVALDLPPLGATVGGMADGVEGAGLRDAP